MLAAPPRDPGPPTEGGQAWEGAQLSLPARPRPSPITPPAPLHGVTIRHHREPGPLGPACWAGKLSLQLPGVEQSLGGGLCAESGGMNRARVGGTAEAGGSSMQGPGAMWADASSLREHTQLRRELPFPTLPTDCTLLQRKPGRPGYFYLSIRSHSADSPQSTGTYNSGRICCFLVKNSWE